MNQSGSEFLEKIHAKILKLGLALDIFLPLVIFFLAVYFRDKLLHVQAIRDLDLFFYVLLAVSLSEAAAIFIIKKKFSAHLGRINVGQGFSLARTQGSREGLPYGKIDSEQDVGQGFSPERDASHSDVQLPGHQNLLSFAVVIFAICFSPTIYGLIYYILGGTWEHFAMFVAITFLFFQLFKPKMEELEKLTRDLDIG